jgi:type II secretory pathway pseudopilin PulG
MMRRTCGATLVEMIVFIVIMGIVVAGLAAGFSNALRAAPQSKLMTEALERAKERLELIRAQRARLGFSGFTNTTYDLCPASTHPACAETTVQACFYTGTAALSTCGFGSTTQCFAGNTDYKCVRVRALDTDGNVMAELDEAFGNF